MSVTSEAFLVSFRNTGCLFCWVPEHDSFIAYKAWNQRNILYICCLIQGDDTAGPVYCVRGRESKSTSLGW